MSLIPLFCVVLFTSLVGALPRFPSGSDSSVKIVGGEPATSGEFPFLVSLQIKGKNGQPNSHTCGATLFNMSRVITAASCVRSAIPNNFVIVAGAYTMLEAVNGQQQFRNVRAITLHPDYVSPAASNDLAVVDVSIPFESTATVRPLPLARRREVYSGSCQIAGWGASRYEGLFSDRIMKGNVSIHERGFCKRAYPVEYDETKEICANGVNERGELVDSCTGDVGGPLICGLGEEAYLAGVSSYGYMCGATEKPRVFMEIAKYRAWLDSVLLEGGTTTAATPPPTTTSAPTKKPSGGVPDNPVGQPASRPGQSPCFLSRK